MLSPHGTPSRYFASKKHPLLAKQKSTLSSVLLHSLVDVWVMIAMSRQFRRDSF
jgi:hypothetical protein